MITRFDHAVIAVSDLERAVEAYCALDSDVEPGDRHEHRGTHSAIVCFDFNGFAVDLLTPLGEGPVGDAIAEEGEGPFGVRINVADVNAADEVLTGASV